MIKYYKVICANCGSIQSLKEDFFNIAVIEGKISEVSTIINGHFISGVNYCLICE